MEIIKMGGKINHLVGQYLKKKRLESGLTGAEIGKLLHISQQQISRYERGENTVSLSVALFFLNTLGCSVEEFFNYLLSEIEMKENASEMALQHYLNTTSREKHYLSI